MFRNNQAEFNQTYRELIERVYSFSSKMNIFLYVSLSFQFKLMCYTQQLKFVIKVIRLKNSK